MTAAVCLQQLPAARTHVNALAAHLANRFPALLPRPPVLAVALVVNDLLPEDH